MHTDPPVEAIAASMSGDPSFQSELAFPFSKEVVKSLSEAGVPELDDSHDFSPPPWLAARAGQPPTAMLDPLSLGVSLVLFSRTPAGEWAIEKICETLWEGAAKPALRRLFGRREPGTRAATETVRLRMAMWFEEDRLFVEVVADVAPGDDVRTLEQLISEAFRLAGRRIDAQGNMPAVLTYLIQGGTIGDPPIQSARPIP